MGKVARAAAYHNPRTAGFAGLSGFQGGAMTPAQLREQLFIAFGIKLTHDEIHSLMSVFDADLSGKVDGAEFLVQFFKIGLRVRLLPSHGPRLFFGWVGDCNLPLCAHRVVTTKGKADTEDAADSKSPNAPNKEFAIRQRPGE